MLRALKGKVDNMQEQMGNVNREMKNLRKNHGEILEIKNTMTEYRMSFMGTSIGSTQQGKNQ